MMGVRGKTTRFRFEVRELELLPSPIFSASPSPPKPPASYFLFRMDDLTSLKTTLVSEASNFVSLFSSKLEQTESDLETAAILESFWEVLDGEPGEEPESREFRMVSEWYSAFVYGMMIESMSLEQMGRAEGDGAN